jgi:glycosyltransferase involved in cell wall biosynthesis
MRILQLGPYPPPHGGVQTNLVAIRRFLLDRGIPCAVINITRHRKTDQDEIYYPASALELIILLLKLRYDIIHLHVGGILSQRVLRLGLICTMLPGRRTVFTFHSGGYPSMPQGRSITANSFAGIVLRRFDRVIGVNQEIMDFFQKLRLSPDRMRLILPHAFLDENVSLGTLPEPVETFMAEHHPVFISAGQLEPEYDLPLQIRVLGKAREKFPHAGLVMLGQGTLEQQLRSLIQSQNYAEHVLLCGDVAHAYAMQAIARASIMLRTTLYDGDAISVREALHLGTPVIATDNGMRPEGVHLVPKQNLEALRRSIEEVLSAQRHPRRRDAIGGESNLEAVLMVYQELMDKN